LTARRQPDGGIKRQLQGNQEGQKMVNRNDLELELRKIRRDRGLTYARLEACPAVLEALGNPPLRVAYHRLAAQVRSLGTDLQARALRTAYAVDMAAPRSLTLRRWDLAVAEKVGVDALKDYENKMIKELALRLLYGDWEPDPAAVA
jgi:hypothetical protein